MRPPKTPPAPPGQPTPAPPAEAAPAPDARVIYREMRTEDLEDFRQALLIDRAHATDDQRLMWIAEVLRDRGAVSQVLRDRVANLEPWDSPKRTRRIDETGQPISAEDWILFEWSDITSINDPEDCHRYAKLLLRKPLDKSGQA